MKFKENAAGVEECYKATIKEAELGYLSGPFTYDEVCTELEGKNVRALRRFPQYRYPGAPVGLARLDGAASANPPFNPKHPHDRVSRSTLENKRSGSCGRGLW